MNHRRVKLLPLDDLNHLVQHQASHVLQPAHWKKRVLIVSTSRDFILSIQTGDSHKIMRVLIFWEVQLIFQSFY
jgi:hypothetical protein